MFWQVGQNTNNLLMIDRYFAEVIGCQQCSMALSTSPARRFSNDGLLSVGLP